MTTDPLASLTRKQQRAHTDRARLDALLDSTLTGVLSTVLDGQPWSVPMLIARDGDRVLMHGSTGAGALRHIGQGAPVALTVFALDGIVVATNAFDSSANYRSAVLRGTAQALEGDEAAAALEVLTDRLLPGRTQEVRPTTRRELVATTCLALPIETWIYKERDAGSGEPEPGSGDAAYEGWTGVVPLRTVAGEPVPDDWSTSTAAPPPSVEALRRAFE